MAYGIHVMEEHAFNWVAWANSAGLPFGWPDFYITNTVVMILGISVSAVGWKAPIYALSLPGLMIVNALFFHIGISSVQGRLNPGCLSAMFLFLPLAWACFRGAHRDGVLNTKIIVLAILLGAAWQASPLIFSALAPMLSY